MDPFEDLKITLIWIAIIVVGGLLLSTCDMRGRGYPEGYQAHDRY